MNYLKTAQLIPNKEKLKEVGQCCLFCCLNVPVLCRASLRCGGATCTQRAHSVSMLDPTLPSPFIRIVRFTCLSMPLLPSNTKAYLNSYGKHLCPERFCLQNAGTPASVCMRHNCACLHFYLLVFVGRMRMQSLSGLCTGELLITCGKYKPIL